MPTPEPPVIRPERKDPTVAREPPPIRPNGRRVDWEASRRDGHLTGRNLRRWRRLSTKLTAGSKNSLRWIWVAPSAAACAAQAAGRGLRPTEARLGAGHDALSARDVQLPPPTRLRLAPRRRRLVRLPVRPDRRQGRRRRRPQGRQSTATVSPCVAYARFLRDRRREVRGRRYSWDRRSCF